MRCVLQGMRRFFGCAAFLLMSVTPTYTYDFGGNPAIDIPRFLVSDTGPAASGEPFVFADQEIQMATFVELSVWQSAQFFSGPLGKATLGTPPMPWRRIAAQLQDSLAANTARLSGILQILDVKMDLSKAAKALQDQAAINRQTD